MTTTTPVKWRRVEAGWYETWHGGRKYELVNMRGQSVRWSGSDTPCWEIRIDGHGFTTCFTMTEAKQKLAQGWETR